MKTESKTRAGIASHNFFLNRAGFSGIFTRGDMIRD
jgi:hypothetical protein